MYSSISVRQVLNSEEELMAFPIEGVVQIAFDGGKPDSFLLEQNAYIIRVDSGEDVQNPSIDDVRLRAVGTIDLDRYDLIPTRLEIVEEVGQWILKISPIEALVPKAKYYVILSKNLAPQFYTIEKLQSYGSSNISLEYDTNTSGEDAQYVFTITQKSQLSTGTHLIEFDVLKNGLPHESGVVLDIRNATYQLADGIEVRFDPDIPFLVGERFSIIMNTFTRLGETLVQTIITNLDSEVIQPAPDIVSQRLSESSVLEFYEKFGYARRVGESGAGTASQGSEIDVLVHYPNIIELVFDKEIDPSSVTDSTFSADIGPAFGKYMLSGLGLYNDAAEYIAYYKVSGNKIIVRVEPSTTTTGQKVTFVQAP